MTVTLLVPDAPTSRYAAVFTRNALAGAPVVVGRGLIPPAAAAAADGGDEEGATNVDAQGETRTLGAIVINNKAHFVDGLVRPLLPPMLCYCFRRAGFVCTPADAH